MTTPDLPEALRQDRIVAVLRASHVERAPEIVARLVESGIRSIELTLTIENALELIDVCAAVAGAVIGVGTVLTREQAEAAVDAGARFLVTPAVRPEVLAVARERAMPTIAGAFTPTEVAAAIDAGATAVKLFPAELGGPKHLLALSSVYRTTQFIPSGGVSAETASAWLDAGAVAVSTGSSVASAAQLAAGDDVGIGEAARALVAACRIG